LSRPFSKAGRILLIFAMFVSCGAHWFVLQSVAWTSMLVTHSIDAPFLSAVKTTFDGAHPCGLCETVEEGRNSEHGNDAPPSLNRIELFHQPVAGLLPPSCTGRRIPDAAVAIPTRSSRPPLPPPRAC
jgi:hypothetical protein